jgi:hypothetical protein
MDYANLGGPNGSTDNMGGTTQRIFLAPTRHFTTVEEPITNPTTLAERVEIPGDHVLANGKAFTKVYCTQDKGKVELKPQGEHDGASYKQEGEFFYPGNESAAHGFADMVKNDNFIILVETPDTKTTEKYLQVGTTMFPAKIKPEFTSATNASGVRGYTFKYDAMTDKQYVYCGALDLTT